MPNGRPEPDPHSCQRPRYPPWNILSLSCASGRRRWRRAEAHPSSRQASGYSPPRSLLPPPMVESIPSLRPSPFIFALPFQVLFHKSAAEHSGAPHSAAMDGAPILAVVLDLDGTLLDTERATGGVLKEFLAGYGKVLDIEKEDRRLGMTHKESAAAIVVDYELPLTAEEFSAQIMPMYRKRWPQAKAIPGANRLIRHLHKHGIPLALASNSIRKHVDEKISYQKGWKEFFTVILGGDDVNHGKPSPDMFLKSAEIMRVNAFRCLVIEDSLVGVTAAKAAGMKVVAVPSLPGQADHYAAADCVLHSLLEFQPDLWGLPAFDDWIQNTLPIEPLHAKGLLCKGAPLDGSFLMDEFAENDSSTYLPCQLSGIFFGWAKLGAQGIFKLVMSIEWDISSNGIKRLIKPCILSEAYSHTVGKELFVIVIGYIRKMNREVIKDDSGTTLGVIKEDMDTAVAVLDLPMFSEHTSDPFLVE